LLVAQDSIAIWTSNKVAIDQLFLIDAHSLAAYIYGFRVTIVALIGIVGHVDAGIIPAQSRVAAIVSARIEVIAVPGKVVALAYVG